MIIYGQLPILYQQAIKLLAYSLQKDFDAQARIGMELEHRWSLENRHYAMVDGDIEHIDRRVQRKTVNDHHVYQGFYREVEPEKYEIVTKPLPPGLASEALREFVAYAKKWVKNGLLDQFTLGLDPFYKVRHSTYPCTLSQHANIDVCVKGKELFYHKIPDHMNAMMQETLHQNILLLIEAPETFVARTMFPKRFRVGEEKDTTCTLCRRMRKSEQGSYLEIRCADAKADPEALEMLALLGTYLGLQHEEAVQTSTNIPLPTTIQTSAHWFKHGTLLEETLNTLSARYGAEVGVPAGLGSMLHQEVMKKYQEKLPNFSEALKIKIIPVAEYTMRGGLPGV